MNFSYFAHAYYQLLATIYTFQVATTIIGTMPDEDGDNQLEAGDSDTGGTWDGFPTDYGNFIGTVTIPTNIGPIIMPVFESSTGAVRVLSLEDTVVNWPNELPSIDTEAVFALCFAEGTGIATPGGETAVEALKIGDTVRTADGRSARVRWIGRQTIVKRFHGVRGAMVRIAAGVLGNHSDLCVTGDHGMVIDGFVINASALVNGGDIDWVPLAEMPERYTVYHVETEGHEVILANGAASESFIDYAGRLRFDNHAEYAALYGADRTIAEAQMPRISAARHLPPSVRARLGLATDDARLMSL